MTGKNPLLPKIPRNAAQMLTWIDQTHARFNTKQLKAEAREGKHFANELILEARPMALFARRYYGASDQVIITHVIGNQNYDGIVEDRRAKPDTIRFREVTTTLRTYEDALRMEELSRRGHVAAYGRVRAIGPKHNRTAIVADGMALEHTKIRSAHLQLVEDAVRRKAKKQYQPDTALIIAVDDSVPFREEADVAVLRTLATKTLVPPLATTNFSMLAREGSNHAHETFAIPRC
jgi:hypothetical protein